MTIRATAQRAALAVGSALFGVMAGLAQTSSPGLYTEAQAAQGQRLYDEQCASCHGPLRAIVPDVAALLADHTFRSKWRGRPIGELFGLILDTMPQDAPGTLSPPQSAEVVAYILSGNRVPAGDVPLADDAEQLNQIPFDP